jgi:hypothetical protein
VSLVERLVREPLLGVVHFDEVLVNSTRLPECETRIWVLDSRGTTVWVDVGVGLLLNILETKRLDFVVQTQLFE